jgi:hypothetical protein
VDGRPLEVVHRDVSPQNVMVSFDGAIKLVDFGIAKAGALMERSKPGVIKGKFLYLSPEQLSQERLDHRADLFALGTMMYELTLGKAPFYKPTTEAVIYSIRNDEPIPPEQIRPDFPPELSRIILKCLVKDRNQRYQHAADVQRELLAFVQGLQLGQLELSSYVGQLFGTEDERTLLHIPTAEVPAAMRLPVGKRPTAALDPPPLPEEPATRFDKGAPPPRPGPVAKPPRRLSEIQYASVGAEAEPEPTHTTNVSVAPAAPGNRSTGGTPGGPAESTLPPGDARSGEPVFEDTPMPSSDFLEPEPTGDGPPDTGSLPGVAPLPLEPLTANPPVSRARSFLVFALAFTVVLVLGLGVLWLLRPAPEPSDFEPIRPLASPSTPRPDPVHPAPTGAADTSTARPPSGPDPGSRASQGAVVTGSPADAGVSAVGQLLFRAPKGTLVQHGAQRIPLNVPREVPAGTFDYAYQCPGKRLLINGSVKVTPQGGRPLVVPLKCPRH